MIDIKDLRVIFDEGTPLEKLALHDFSLAVDEGEFICVLGTNGSGKSTLFNAILGQIRYDGSIILDGKPLDKVKQFRRARQIGVVYQDPMKGSAPNLSVEENLLLFSKKRFLSPSVRKEYLRQCIEDLTAYGLGLEEKMKTPVKALSGGQRQVLSLYMATVSNPKLLLLDEHTAALDPQTSEKVMEVTKSIVKNKNITTLMVIHNLDYALAYGDRLLILSKGSLVFDAKGEEKQKLTKDILMRGFGEHLDASAFLD